MNNAQYTENSAVNIKFNKSKEQVARKHDDPARVKQHGYPTMSTNKKTIPKEVLKSPQTSLNQDGKQTLKPIRPKEQLVKKHDGSAHRKTNPKEVSNSCQRSQNQDEKQLPNIFHVGEIGVLPLIDNQGKTARKHIVPSFGRQQKSFSTSKESQTNTVQTRMPANGRTCPKKCQSLVEFESMMNISPRTASLLMMLGGYRFLISQIYL